MFLARVLSMPKTYVATNMKNHNLRKTEFQVKSCSEASLKTRYS